MTKTVTAWALTFGWLSRGTSSPESRRNENICFAAGAISKILTMGEREREKENAGSDTSEMRCNATLFMASHNHDVNGYRHGRLSYWCIAYSD